jgi:hypothetical protein
VKPLDQDALSITLYLSDPALADEEREQIAAELFRQLREAEVDLGEIRRSIVSPPPGAKSTLSVVVGALTVIVSAATLRPIFDYLKERLRKHEITLEIEASKARKVKLTVRSAEDLVVAYHAAVALLAGDKED